MIVRSHTRGKEWEGEEELLQQLLQLVHGAFVDAYWYVLSIALHTGVWSHFFCTIARDRDMYRYESGVRSGYVYQYMLLVPVLYVHQWAQHPSVVLWEPYVLMAHFDLHTHSYTHSIVQDQAYGLSAQTPPCTLHSSFESLSCVQFPLLFGERFVLHHASNVEYLNRSDQEIQHFEISDYMDEYVKCSCMNELFLQCLWIDEI